MAQSKRAILAKTTPVNSREYDQRPHKEQATKAIAIDDCFGPN